MWGSGLRFASAAGEPAEKNASSALQRERPPVGWPAFSIVAGRVTPVNRGFVLRPEGESVRSESNSRYRRHPRQLKPLLSSGWSRRIRDSNPCYRRERAASRRMVASFAGNHASPCANSAPNFHSSGSRARSEVESLLSSNSLRLLSLRCSATRLSWSHGSVCCLATARRTHSCGTPGWVRLQMPGR